MADQLGPACLDSSAWERSTHAAPLSVIWSLLGRHIAFHRRLVDLTDNPEMAQLAGEVSQRLQAALDALGSSDG